MKKVILDILEILFIYLIFKTNLRGGIVTSLSKMAVGVAMAARLKLVSLPSSLRSHRSSLSPSSSRNSSAAPTISASQFTTTTTTTTSSNPNFKLNMPCSSSSSPSSSATDGKVIDSHLHVWASPQEVKSNHSFLNLCCISMITYADSHFTRFTL